MTTASLSQGTLTGQHSIRWRLPLSYAGIALLTAVALAGLLLFTLRSYYDRQERKYLNNSARILARQTERMLEDQLSVEQIQSTVSLFAFLAQARVKLLGSDRQIITDSGPMDTLDSISVGFVREPLDNNPGPGAGPYLGLFQSFDPAQSGEPPPPDQGYHYPVPMGRGSFGQFLSDDASPGERSDQRVRVPVRALSGDVVAYLELSEGPAFGSEIIGDVAEKGVVAGAVAILIAAAAGVIVSRNISQPVLALADVTRQMAHGDLAARVTLRRRDEFGLLAHTFNAMAGRVEATVSTLKQFVADAAHEINTPLTALRTNLELTAAYEMPDAARTDIEQALAELKRLEMLTGSLVTLARLEAPGTMPQRAPVELGGLLRQMHERYASRAEQAGIVLDLEAPQEAVHICADRSQVIRMLDNLLDNAMKFTPSGGRVTLGMRTDDPFVHLWVQDTGIGIPESDLPHLFNRFHRGRNAAPYPGNGLGLVITRAIVEEHGGSIHVESSPERTCFTVRLPCDFEEKP